MKEQLKKFDEIIHGKLRPWINHNISDHKLNTLLKELKKVHYSYQPKYELNFINALLPIRKYYSKIIDNEATIFLNHIHAEIEAAINQNEKKYLTHKYLRKLLDKRLRNVAGIIKQKDYRMSDFIHTNNMDNNNIEKANESYIIYLLKYQLIRLYKEIQDNYSNYLDSELKTDEEIHYNYFLYYDKSEDYIKEAEQIGGISEIQISETKEIEESLEIIEGDFRKEKKNIIKYQDIIKGKKLFSLLENKLFETQLIDNKYNFIKKYGNQKYFAAIIHQMIKNGYFKDSYFDKKPKAIEYIDVIKFIEHRYNAVISKEFNKLKNDTIELQKQIERHYWLEKLKDCH